MRAARALSRAVGCSLAALALSEGAAALPVVMTFDERLQAPADGLSLLGVTFGQLDSGSGGPSPSVAYFGDSLSDHDFVNGYSLVGESYGQQLAVDFAAPTSLLEFGVLLEDPFQTQDQVTVDLYDASQSLIATLPVTLTDTDDAYDFEALFHYDGAPVSRAVLSFDPFASRYAIDNLTYLNAAVVRRPPSRTRPSRAPPIRTLQPPDSTRSRS